MLRIKAWSLNNSWSFDIGSFMVLVGDYQETEYRLMQRCILECFTAAPVSGLQSYTRPFSALTDVNGREYISVYGGKKAPLRNMRLSQTLASKELLKDGRCLIYRISPHGTERRSLRLFLCLILWILCSWMIFCGIIASVWMSELTTWIGVSSCISLTLLSTIIRLVENRSLEITPPPPTAPEQQDAVIFLGRRNSCFVLEGTREDVARWTGFGLQVKSGPRYRIGEIGIRLASLGLLVFVFTTVPNGSTWDQVAFICLNLLGLTNNVLGRFLGGSRCLASLVQTFESKVETRTHVYGFLLRHFGGGVWVDQVDLIPKTPVWTRWKEEVVKSDLDAKVVYQQSFTLYKNGRLGLRASSPSAPGISNEIRPPEHSKVES